MYLKQARGSDQYGIVVHTTGGYVGQAYFCQGTSVIKGHRRKGGRCVYVFCFNRVGLMSWNRKRRLAEVIEFEVFFV